jgi:hypothetical protein
MLMHLNGIIPDPWLATTVTVPASRCGPPGMANGGWVSGTVAGHLGAGPIEVTLRAPTPPDTPLDLRAADDDATLSLGDQVLVSARRSPGAVHAPEPVDWAAAEAAEAGFVGHHDHPFPGCFVCGTERAVGDGLRIFPGAVAGGRGRMAAVFTPAPAHAGAHGRLPAAAVWAALDCPTAWVNMTEGAVALLGRLRAELRGDLRPGRPYLVVAESAGVEGRKAYGRAAIYERDGRLLAASQATWISVADETSEPKGRAGSARSATPDFAS